MAKEYAISARGLCYRYENAEEDAVKGIDIDIAEGEFAAILGRNGSGKTVLMKCICGFLRPTTGAVKVFGKKIGTDCDFARDTGILIETPGFLNHETGLKNLLWLARLGKGATRERVESMIRLTGLDPALKKKVSLSLLESKI